MLKNTLLLILMLFSTALFAQKTRTTKRVLIFTKNALGAYRHESIEAGRTAVKAICEQNGIAVDTSENAELFNDATLKQYSALVLLSANQDIFDSEQEAALQRYIWSGGGFVGVHAASGVERNWLWFSQLLGGTFVWHTKQQHAIVKVIDKKHPSTKHMPKRWKHWDEWYYFGKPNPNLHVVAALDTTTFKSDRHTQDYPFSWYQEFEGGRSFYTAGGHNIADFSDQIFLKHILGGINYAIGKNEELNYDNVKKHISEIKLMTVDPGHFHAALVQKSMYPNVNPTVNVYSTENEDVKAHLARIEGYNKRTENPTKWQEDVYYGADFFEKMIKDKKGNAVVLSGNNRKKTEYITKSLDAGFHVLADKPMVINSNDFNKLKEAFLIANKNKKLLYDIMTERFEITTLLQRELSRDPSVFGKLEQGTPENPAITKESVHHFYKYVSGSVLTRPIWFMDTEQQGEGIVDVMTHLVDLVQWAAFPEQTLDYTKDIKINLAKRWTTDMSLNQFKTITKTNNFPDYLNKNVIKDSLLQIYCNGEINYQLKGVHAKTSVIWNYKAPEGTGDTHYSTMRGTKANLVIKQGAEESYKSTLYIEPVGNSANSAKYTEGVNDALKSIQIKYPEINFELIGQKYKVIIPEKYRENHEAHFARVTERFLNYLQTGNMPAWEVPNMLAKYYTTTTALEMAKK
jgi:type 1 glutamine amidotransferase/predicted dehydrogenase